MNSPQPEAPTALVIDADTATKATFASVQNAVPIIRRLAVRNDGDRAFNNLKLSMLPQPGFCRPKEWTIDSLGPGQAVEVDDRRITLDFAVLDRLNEAEHGQLTFRLHHNGEPLAERVVPIELLARDEWGGSDEMAQILAAFVAPNHPAIGPVLKEASRLLERAGHGGALNGYESRDPRRAYMIAASIWSAVAGLGLSYALPPRSFERHGQKIRDPGCVIGAGLATCLDTTLLLAAAFEAVRLNPVVVFTEGHAFLGVWLVDKTFPLTLEHDVTEVRKAVQANELVVLETTLLTGRPPAGFAQAKANAASQLAEDAERAFRMAVDVTRARAAGIRPISTPEPAEQYAAHQDDAVSPPPLPGPPGLDEIPAEYAEELSATPRSRLDRWQKKLLDLSLRNRLLNFSDTKQTLGLVCADVAALEDALASGAKFRIISLKDENPVGDRDPQIYRQQTGRDIQHDFVQAAFEKGQVCSVETGRETQARLTTLYRKAKSDLAEGGANTLFMAVGFLRWKKNATDERAYKAPLLLLPIKLERRSANAHYFLSHHEDDVVFNQTLLEFLERDFRIAIPSLRAGLPTDDAGVDIKQTLGIVKQAVREAPGFEVVEETAVSTFSFSKYLMWKDLVDRTDSLRNNRLVRHLLDNPTEPFSDGLGPIPSPKAIDERVAPSDLYTPLPADSSQLAAVLAAESGKDFVIIGPPGTGKSQTIANVIAHCLSRGKTVLFVAEKSAALDVVHRRLKAYGLADACLELHSNKADRKSVLAQLGAAWDRASNTPQDEWIRIGESLRIERDELNHYVADLHEPGSHGRSIYHGIGVVLGRDPRFTLSFPSIDAHDAKAFDALVELADRLALAYRAVANCSSLDSVTHTEWSFAWQKELLEAAERLREEALALTTASTRLGDALGLPPDPQAGVQRLAGLNRLASAIGAVAPADFRFAAQADPDALAASLGDLEKAATEYAAARSALSASFDDEHLLNTPVGDLDQEWRRECAKLWPLSALGKRRVRKMLQSYASAGTVVPETDLPALVRMKRALETANASPARATPGFAGVRSDLSALRDTLRKAQELRAAAAELAPAGDGAARLWERIQAVLPPDAASGELARAAEALREANARFEAASGRYASAAGGPVAAPSLQELVDRLDALRRDSARLNDWVKWCRVREEARGHGLEPMIDALRAGRVEDPRNDFRVAYFHWWAPLAIDRKPRLRGFVHWEQQDRIKRFKDLVQAMQKLTAEQVRRAVSHGLPARDGVPRKSELGVLRYQLGLQRPSASIRSLIESMPQTLTKLTPCVLMSPLSVAQYLPPEQAMFDIVIFDEASQITTWDAIGSIARGRQSIIVGDPKQLPPTNFFGRTDDEEDLDLDLHERDLPSILDEASAAGLPLHQLNWHYRSRDEGLIAFSNYHYYNQQLVTFPAPAADGRSVRFHKVDGVYARGAGRTNEIEARAVVGFVVERLEEWSTREPHDRLSIGVITFNAQQQELILDLLDAERAKRPHLEWFFSDEREEPVIVKNLENVQGDERDVMVFSITFGRDPEGRLAMDFGAVNRDGGEKRLNVAVTRAKSEFHVFASITADDVDLRRAKGKGVAHLKNYLAYAERGASALPGADAAPPGSEESPFEESVADMLRSRGWEVRTHVGVSRDRIALGVVHPDKPGAYLAGVECDGPTYQGSATARDRDQIREDVLRALGWNVLRVWSTDWFMRRDDALERLDQALKQLLEAARERQAPAKAAPAPAPVPAEGPDGHV